MRAVDASASAPSPDESALDGSVLERLEIRDAATVLLVSDRPDLHVLMLERTSRAVFGPGATVFPGGAVDAADREARSHSLVFDLDDRVASREQGLPLGGLDFRVAALRECFEESGILLAHGAASGRAVLHDASLVAAREQCNDGTLSFVELLERRSLVLAARDLRLFSHWLTPIGAPRRYNTWFFVAPAPAGEDGVHDDRELVASEWVRPADALARFAAGAIDLIFPTEMSLRALAGYEHAADVFADLDAAPHDVDGNVLVISDGTGE